MTRTSATSRSASKPGALGESLKQTMAEVIAKLMGNRGLG
jgi:hypothetical protein